MKRLIPNFVILLLLGLLFTGCATRYSVKLDALATGEGVPASGSVTYDLASGTPGVEESDLFFKEVARFLEPVLRESGFRPAGEGETADIRIEVDAYISEPMIETQTYSDPVYLHTTGHVRYMRVPVVGKDGKVVRYAYSRYYYPGYTYNAGWVERDRQVTVFDKVLKLSASQVTGEDQYSDEVWALTVSLKDGSTDYRAALPYMLVAARPYIGRRTEGEQYITLTAEDPEVAAYRTSISDGR